MSDAAGLLKLDDIKSAYSLLKTYPSDQYHKTPLLSGAEHLFNLDGCIKLHLKLENTQVTGECCLAFCLQKHFIMFRKISLPYNL